MTSDITGTEASVREEAHSIPDLQARADRLADIHHQEMADWIDLRIEELMEDWDNEASLTLDAGTYTADYLRERAKDARIDAYADSRVQAFEEWQEAVRSVCR
jgi:hypothetical protein